MASIINPTPFRIHFIPSKPNPLRSKSLIFVPRIPFKSSRIFLSVKALSAPRPPPPAAAAAVSDQIILDIIDGDDVESLPCIRTYENDLGRLTVVGSVDLDQALTAAAADGGEAASEHIVQGLEVMVAETMFPGRSDENSTISTRLFLPAKKVKERAKALKNLLTEDVLSSTTDILAMTFRQVTVQQLWNFELVVFRAGTIRNMKELGNPREVPSSFTLSSSDEQAISMLAEVISICALKSTERYFLDNSSGESSYNPFRLFPKPEKIVSKNSSVVLYEFLEDGVARNANGLLEKFNSVKPRGEPLGNTLKFKWWASSTFAKLEEVGGPKFSTWVSEYVPAYRLQINSDKLQHIKFEGWKEAADNILEVILSHSQMVSLANILDMYYEDLFTLPDKQLPYVASAKSANMAINKRGSSLLKMLSTVLVSGSFILAISILGRLYLPHIQNSQKYPGGNVQPQSSQTGSIHLWSMDPDMLEDVCVSIVKKMQAAYGWNEEIRKESGGGISTGKLPEYLQRLVQVGPNDVDISSKLNPSEDFDEEMQASIRKIASYQLVLSSEGKIVGFQPTSLLGVNNWASNVLTKELYGGKKLSPGFIEPSLKIKQPSEVVVLELVMSEADGSNFVWVRPVKVSDEF